MTTNQTAYIEALNMAAGWAMGWLHTPKNFSSVWFDSVSGEIYSDWDPTHDDEHLGMVLAKVMSGNKAYRLILENRHSIEKPAWLATIYGPHLKVACECGDGSWRVALVKALVVASGGELPEEVKA